MRGPAVELEAQHPAESGHELHRLVVVWMRGQPRVVGSSDSGVAVEESGELRCIRVVTPHPYGHRFQAALEQEPCVGIQAASQLVQGLADPLDHGSAPHDAAGDQIGMTVQVLGGAVEAEIEAHGQWLEVDRGGEGVVYDTGQLVLAREADDVFEARDPHEWVPDAFDEEHLRIRGERRWPIVRTAGIHQGMKQPEPLDLSGDVLEGSTVELSSRDQMIPGPEKRGQYRAHSGRTRGRGDGRLGSF